MYDIFVKQHFPQRPIFNPEEKIFKKSTFTPEVTVSKIHIFRPEKKGNFQCLVFISVVLSPKYRVNIKSFPDYKHLLQENYVE